MMRMLQPTAQALSAAECPILVRTGAAMAPGVSAAEAWAEVRAAQGRRGGQLDALAQDDLRALDAFFDELGETGRECQALMLSETIDALERNLEIAGERAQEAERLYGALGLLTGLMLALIAL